MNKEAYRMLKEIGMTNKFFGLLVLRSPFDILNSVLLANMMQSFIRIIEREQKEMLWGNVVLYFILTVLLFGYNMTIWSTLAVNTTVLIQKKLRIRVFEQIMELPPGELEEAFGADWFTRLNNDVDKAVGYLFSPINYMHVVIAFVNLCISSVIMIIMDTKLYIIGMVWVLAAFFVNVFIISGRITKYKTSARESLVEYTQLIDVSVKDREILSVFEGGEFVREKIEEKSLNILKENMKVHNRVSLCNMTYAFSGMLGYLMMLAGGSDLNGEGINDFATLCKMTQYRAGTVISVNCIYNGINNMKGGIVGVKRINEIITDKPQTDKKRKNV